MGYGTLAWINGGLDTAKKTDLPVKGEFDDLRYGGIGGLSELLGWTDVQREKSAGFLGAARRRRPCAAAAGGWPVLLRQSRPAGRCKRQLLRGCVCCKRACTVL